MSDNEFQDELRAAANRATSADPGRPLTAVEAADQQEKYDRMLRLADLFDTSGEEMRQRAKLGGDVLRDEGVAESAPLSQKTFDAAAEEIRNATTGKHGLLTRSIELDADALIVRATVLTYRWIDELQDAAYKTLGSIAGRAIGFLAPSVALGGAIVSAGLIETDALDRDGIAEYLAELAENNPDLLDHVTSGGGGLLDGLLMRSMLTAGVLAGDSGRQAAAGGLRAIGIGSFEADSGAALRDAAGPLVGGEAPIEVATAASHSAPRTLEDLMSRLDAARGQIQVDQIAPGRFIAYLPGRAGGRRLRLVGSDTARYSADAVAVIESAVGDTPDAKVMLVGAGVGGTAAAEIAAGQPSTRFTVEQVITAGSPAAGLPALTDGARILSLEDRADPVALLGSLINAGSGDRLTVVFDGGLNNGSASYVAGGRAADLAANPDLRAEIKRIESLGYLAG